MAISTTAAAALQKALGDTPAGIDAYQELKTALNAAQDVQQESSHLDGVTAGTAAASKAVVLSAAGKIDTIDITTLKIGGTTVAATAAKLDYTNVTTAGTAQASKALVTDASIGIAGLALTSASLIVSSATPSTTRLVRSELTLTPTGDTMAVQSNGSLAAVRGCVTLSSGDSLTDGYAYGVQGKFVGDGATVAVGSDHIAGVLAQMSGSSMTATSGHIAPLIVSGQSLPADPDVNMIYCESGGNKVNAVLQSNVACDFFLDVNNFESCGIVATPAGSVASGNLRTLKIQIDGATYLILAAAAYGAT